MATLITSSSREIECEPPGLELRKFSLRLRALGYHEFGLACEAFLSNPTTVVRAAARIRKGSNMERAATALIYREARTNSAIKAELVAWLAFRLHFRGNEQIAQALRNYPAEKWRTIDGYLLGQQSHALLKGSFPGRDALLNRFSRMLGPIPATPSIRIETTPEQLVLAMFFLTSFDREILRRVLVGEDSIRIGAAMDMSSNHAERMMTRVLNTARRRMQRRNPV